MDTNTHTHTFTLTHTSTTREDTLFQDKVVLFQVLPLPLQVPQLNRDRREMAVWCVCICVCACVSWTASFCVCEVEYEWLVSVRGRRTMVLVAREVLGINNQVMVSVQFPELAVKHIKMLIREEGELLVDVRLCLQATDHL